MRFSIVVPIIFSITVVVTLSGCAGGDDASGQADLIPVPQIFSFDPPNFSFCKLDSEGKLVVTVRNQGDAQAPTSKVLVTFSPGGPSPKQDTGPISASDSVDLAFDIPAGCFTADCAFTISVNDDNQVDESEDGNNTASGTCIG